MSKTASFQQIKTNIDGDINACNTLLQLLESERQALKDRDPTTLDGIIEEKTTNLQHLEHSAVQRSAWLGANPTIDPQNKWLDLLKQTNQELIPLWKTLQDKLKDCQTQNEINGKVLARNQQIFKRILGIVRGQSAPQDLYTQKGNRSNNGFQQTIGEA